jgi:hypothetical protein
MPVATVLVHQLRYLLAYGPGAGHELVEQGDAYTRSLVPWLAAVLLPLFLGGLVLAVARSARARGATRAVAAGEVSPPRSSVLWAGAFAALLAGYVAQESLEVVLGSAHVTVLAQAFGSGGWWAVPAAALVAGAWALVARGTHAALAAAARLGSRCRASCAARDLECRHFPKRSPCTRRACPLSRRHAGRAPPAVSLV